MKLKIKGGFKGLAIEHGEKAVFGLAVICFLLLAYSLKRDTLPDDKQPNKLAEEVKRADEHIAHSIWDPVREGISVTDYVTRAKREEVVALAYELKLPLDQPIRVPKHKRSEPTLLAIEQLRVSSGVGAFALKGDKPKAAAAAAGGPAEPRRRPRRGADGAPAPDVPAPRAPVGAVAGSAGRNPLLADIPAESKLAREHWAVVTGLVPVKRQIAEFEQTFKDTIPITDKESLTATERDLEKNRDKPVYLHPVIERAEVVEGDEENLDWQPINLTSSTKFMLTWAIKRPDIVGAAYTDRSCTMPLGPLVSQDWDESVGHEPEIKMATKEELERKADEDKRAEEDKQGAIDSTIGFGEAEVGNKPGARPKPTNAPKTAEKKPVEYRLFRFFDFSVEPGKTYRYRVRMVLKNPNYNLADKFLKNTASKTDPNLPTPWSEPSPTVSIPSGMDLLAGGVTPAKSPKEASIKIKLITLDPEMGLEAVHETDAMRGTVLNMKAEVEVPNPLSRQPEKREEEFETNAVVLDIRGGTPVPGTQTKAKLTEPGEVLLWKTDKLVAHSELDDLDKYSQQEIVEKQPERPAAGGKKDDKPKDKNDALNGATPARPRRQPRNN